MLMPNLRVVAKVLCQLPEKVVVWDFPYRTAAAILKSRKHAQWNIGGKWQVPALKLKTNDVAIEGFTGADHGNVVLHMSSNSLANVKGEAAARGTLP